MPTVIPISPPAVRRDPEEALRELHGCLRAINEAMAALAKLFPNTTAMAGFSRGEPCLTVAYTASQEAEHYTPGAMNSTRSLAEVAITLLPELQDVMALELKLAAERRRLESEMEAAVAGAIRAAKAETHSR